MIFLLISKDGLYVMFHYRFSSLRITLSLRLSNTFFLAFSILDKSIISTCLGFIDNNSFSKLGCHHLWLLILNNTWFHKLFCSLSNTFWENNLRCEKILFVNPVLALRIIIIIWIFLTMFAFCVIVNKTKCFLNRCIDSRNSR